MSYASRGFVGLLALPLVWCSCSKVRQVVLSYEEPRWTATSELSDGRIFVTDEHIAIDVAWAEPDSMPGSTFPASRIEPTIRRKERAASTTSMGLGNVLKGGVQENGTFRGPGGIPLAEVYVGYLRGKFMFHNVVLHSNLRGEDLVIEIDGEYAGVLAPAIQREGLEQQ